MKLNNKRKEAITKHIENISAMGRLELGAFDMKLQEVKGEMDSIVWKWVNKAVINQMAYFMDIDTKTGGAMAIMSELKEDEI